MLFAALFELSYLFIPLTSLPFLFVDEGGKRMPFRPPPHMFELVLILAAAVLPKLVSGLPEIDLSYIVKLSVLYFIY